MAETIALEVGCELDIKRAGQRRGGIHRRGQEAGRPRKPPAAGADRHHHGPRRSRQDLAAGQDPQEQRGRHRGGRHHAGDSRLARGARRPADHLPRHARPRGVHQDARRGANVTDIAVIVVAADDGVMPQTEEAINHAKAAGVSHRRGHQQGRSAQRQPQQDASSSFTAWACCPTTWAATRRSSKPAPPPARASTSCSTSSSVVAELKELKANPNKPASGTCLEAKLSEEEGVFATLLVRDGTLHRGDVILCGAAYGRVRALYDDLGRPIEEAGPSVPVRITGLDEVPNADDPFLVVPDLSEAREIAERRKDRQQAAALTPHKTMRLEDLAQIKVAELKVILKAEVRGSIEAIRKELEKLQPRRGARPHPARRHRRHHRKRRAAGADLAGGHAHPRLQRGARRPRPGDGRGARHPDPRVQHHLQPDRRHAGGAGRQAEAARGGHPPRPGGGARDVQDQPRRHHRRLLRHAGRDRAPRPRSASSAAAW